MAYLLNRVAGEKHCEPERRRSFATFDFFELAVVAATSLFGFESGSGDGVGVLIEVPVTLLVVWIVSRSRG